MMPCSMGIYQNFSLAVVAMRLGKGRNQRRYHKEGCAMEALLEEVIRQLIILNSILVVVAASILILAAKKLMEKDKR